MRELRCTAGWSGIAPGPRNKNVARLSIVIPALGDNAALEAGLVSVLENRPPDSEVLVVLNAPYDDPYQIADEVRFIAAPAGAGLVECLNIGCAHSRGAVIHFLGCGYRVSAGWAETALAHFEHATIGCVVPAVLDAAGPESVTIGLVYERAGAIRRLERNAESIGAGNDAPSAALPLAGFYRAEAIQDLHPPLVASFDPQWAAADLGLRLTRCGYRVVVESASQIEGDPRAWCPTACSFRQGLVAERFFWRHLSAEKSLRTRLAHLVHVAGETLRGLSSARSIGRLAGRSVARIEAFCSSSQLPRVAEAPADHPAVLPERCRVDSGHEPKHAAAARSGLATGSRV